MTVYAAVIAVTKDLPDVAGDIKETRRALGLKGEEAAGAGSLWGKIDPDESHWQLDEGGTVLVATLAKRTAEKWDALLIQETALR